MGEYIVVLNDEQEDFLDAYFTSCPLREEHSREDYPNLVVNNFINSMLKRKNEFVGRYKDKTGKEFVPKRKVDGKYVLVDTIATARERLKTYKDKIKVGGTK